jgi:hypothetical protein
MADSLIDAKKHGVESVELTRNTEGKVIAKGIIQAAKHNN